MYRRYALLPLPAGFTALLAATLLVLVTAVPAHAAIFTVNSTGDGSDASAGNGVCQTSTVGECTLRAAIQEANALAGTDEIRFAIGSGAVTISPASALPNVTGVVVIAGTTQPGYAGVPIVRLDGTSAGASAHGLRITGGSSTVRGLMVTNFTSYGIWLSGTGGNTIAGNYVGTDGTNDLGNGSHGIYVNNVGSNTIGGTTAADRNVISGNTTYGVNLDSPGATLNVIQGNYIGTDATGASALGNGSIGVRIVSGTSNTVGGTASGAGNVISSSGSNGIQIQGGATGTVIQGNYIGTNASGTSALANNGVGIQVSDVSGTTIGGTTAGARNVISGNVASGISLSGAGTTSTLVQGNYIGTDASGTAAVPNVTNGILFTSSASSNTIGGTAAGAGNVISGNGSDGIRIQSTSNGNTIQGNYVGIDATGTADLGNSGSGIAVATGASSNTIGGAAAGARNVISGNNNGIFISGNTSSGNVIQGNYIGTDASGTTAVPNANGVHVNDSAPFTIGGTGAGEANLITGNTGRGIGITSTGPSIGIAIRRNLVYGNGGAEIDLGNNGATTNDADDPDTGPNRLQNFPVVTTASYDDGANEVTLTYTVSTLATNTTYPLTVEFFRASGDGGDLYLGSDTYTEAEAGTAKQITFTPAGSVTVADFIVATATDADGNTSEFSSSPTQLPVELASFTATLDGADAVLAWTTASETNNAGFTVEHHTDGAWNALAFVAGAGTTARPQSYTYRAAGLAPGTHRFRLRQVDYDGASTYGPEVELAVGLPGAYALTEAYPNPFNPQTTLSLSVAAAQRVEVAVYDGLGRRVAVLFEGVMEAGAARAVVFEAAELPGGLYFVRAVGETFEAVRPVTLVK